MTVSETLWVHQQAAIITAESHEIWSFTPDFLLANDIVPADWSCTQATRTQESVEIHLGPTNWQMTESQLWVSVSPDCPFDESPRPLMGSLFLDPMNRFLQTIPYLPTRRLWFFWKISATDPEWRKWTADTFLRNDWPAELGTPMLQPSITARKDDITLRMTIRNQSVHRNGQPVPNSIVFDSYVYRHVDQTPADMISETQHWPERLAVLRQAIKHLLNEGGSK